MPGYECNICPVKFLTLSYITHPILFLEIHGYTLKMIKTGYRPNNNAINYQLKINLVELSPFLI